MSDEKSEAQVFPGTMQSPAKDLDLLLTYFNSSVSSEQRKNFAEAFSDQAIGVLKAIHEKKGKKFELDSEHLELLEIIDAHEAGLATLSKEGRENITKRIVSLYSQLIGYLVQQLIVNDVKGFEMARERIKGKMSKEEERFFRVPPPKEKQKFFSCFLALFHHKFFFFAQNQF